MSEYIKREDALDKFKRMPPSPTKEFIIETLNAIPAADVEPVVRARWMKHEDGDGVVCSHCGMWAAWCAPRLKTQHQSRYCPSCGCLMDMERSGSGE